MDIRTKAALKTLGFLGGAFSGALVFITIGYFFGDKIAMISFATLVMSYLAYSYYKFSLAGLEIEQKYGK